MLVTTTERISGQEYEIIGEVFGLTTRSKNMFKDLGAGLKSVVGGEIKGYTDMQHYPLTSVKPLLAKPCNLPNYQISSLQSPSAKSVALACMPS